MFVDLPSQGCLTFGTPFEFSVTVSNSTSRDYPAVAWLITADPFSGGVGPRGVLAAGLEVLTGVGEWEKVLLVQNHDEASWIVSDWPTVVVARGVKLVRHYRLTLDGVSSGGGTTNVRAFLVNVQEHARLAEAAHAICVKE